jgi:hypothetical protein
MVETNNVVYTRIEERDYNDLRKGYSQLPKLKDGKAENVVGSILCKKGENIFIARKSDDDDFSACIEKPAEPSEEIKESLLALLNPLD